MTITFKVTQHFGTNTSMTAASNLTAGELVALVADSEVDSAGTASTNVYGVVAEDCVAGKNVTIYQGVIECTLETAGAFTALDNIEAAANGTIATSGTAGKVIDFGVCHDAAAGAAEWLKCTLNLPAFVT